MAENVATQYIDDAILALSNATQYCLSKQQREYSLENTISVDV